MNLHEYQGKEILSSFGVRVQRGIVADNHKSVSTLNIAYSALQFYFQKILRRNFFAMIEKKNCLA